MSVEQHFDPTRFALEFANEGQWSNRALITFAATRGVAIGAVRQVWPQGIRDIARALNAAADQGMVETVSGESLGVLIVRRFADNASLKRSVGSLAQSDLLHPFDTLARTEITARAMLRCCGRSDAWHARWRLVFAYSAAVLVWLADTTPDQTTTRDAVRMALALVGFR